MPRATHLLIALLGVCLPWTAAADGAALAESRCAGCHALAATEHGDTGAVARAERRAPPLHYAGDKYRAEWLETWLQAPVRIRPAGYFPPAHVRHDADGDRVDPASLPEHPALDPAEASAVTGFLMTLRAADGLVDPDAYEPGSVALRMGMLDFRKFKGCNACHQDAPGEGGVSGPEVFTAWQRLQPAFLFSYVKNPAAWDSASMMPVPDMNDAAVAKLVNYLKVIGEPQP